MVHKKKYVLYLNVCYTLYLYVYLNVMWIFFFYLFGCTKWIVSRYGNVKNFQFLELL